MARKRNDLKVTGWVKLQDQIITKISQLINIEWRKGDQIITEIFTGKEISKEIFNQMAEKITKELSPKSSEQNVKKKAKASVWFYLKNN